jgi:hypothetical protein
MTTDRIERRLPEILDEISVPQVPDYLDDILSQTARIRPRPGWTFPERWLPMDIAVRTRWGPLTSRTVAIVVILALIVALGVAAVVYVGSHTRRLPPAYGPASNGSIVYERVGDIFTTDPDGHFETPIIGGETNDFSPRWSRDGTTIHFGRTTAQGTAVMAADADGRNVRQLSSILLSDPDAAEVSPGGNQLAAIDHPSGVGSARVAVLDLAGGRTLRILDVGTIRPTTYVNWRPPSGNELVFLGNPDGRFAELGLYVARSDGFGGLRRLAVQHGESTADPRTQLSFQNLVLSDDGRMAGYWNWETTVAAGRTCFVHLIDLDTGDDRRVTFDPTAACELAPAFLADDKILVERQDLVGNSQLLVAPADASAPGLLIGPRFDYRHRVGWAVSPDRREVLFVSDSEPSQLITIATGAARPIQLSLPDAGSWQRLAL